MRKKMTFVLILLILATLTLATQIVVYKWNESNQRWEAISSQQASATAAGNFTTRDVNGNVEGFIPISFLSRDGKRVNFKLNVNISRAKTKLVLKPMAYSHVFGKWTVDNMYLLFDSTNDLNVSYSLEGNVKGYYIAQVDKKKIPKKSKEWKKMDKNVNIDQINLKAGSHEFYLWIGFDKTNDRIFVGPVIFDTYIVPNI